MAFPIHRTLAAAAAAAASLIVACSAQVGPAGTPAAQTVAVSVTPGDVALSTGQSAQFAAAVTGSADVAVVWTVDEGGGGQVTSSGMYTAPSAAGTFHVRATSHADGQVSGVATVTVSLPPAGTVSVSPKTTTVTAGGTVTFTATTTGLASSSVTWSVEETSGCGGVSSAGVYTAPTTARTCHVVATSVSDTSRTDVATIVVTAPIAVAVAPIAQTVDACKTATFTATVSGTSDQAVAWTVLESGGGTVSTAGVYTAPSNAGTYHVVATAHASATATASATVTVQNHILSVAVNPTTAALTVGGTQQFTATVTTSCGAFLATGP